MDGLSILTFSGSGNTQFVVDAVIRSLSAQGVEAISYPMEKFHASPDKAKIVDDFMVGIAFPVHAFNAPPLVEKFVRDLPVSPTPKKYFILKTAGSPWALGGTTTRLQRILARKNWHLQYEALVPMPSNFAVRYPDSFIKLNLQLALRQADRIASDLIAGKKRILPSLFPAGMMSSLLRIEHLGAKFYGHYLKVESNCTLCGRCFRECPTRNITYKDGKFSFGWKCTLCMRCSFDCPVQAYSHKHLGKVLNVKPPYALQRILEDQSIAAADIRDDRIPYMKDYRNFCQREGLLS